MVAVFIFAILGFLGVLILIGSIVLSIVGIAKKQPRVILYAVVVTVIYWAGLIAFHAYDQHNIEQLIKDNPDTWEGLVW